MARVKDRFYVIHSALSQTFGCPIPGEARHKEEIKKGFCPISEGESKRNENGKIPMRMIIGNNDCRSNDQIRGFVEEFKDFHPYPNWKSENDKLEDCEDLVWKYYIDKKTKKGKKIRVAVIGFYLPDKRENFERDHFFDLEKIPKIVKKSISNAIEASDESCRKLRLILLLTHQGFLEDEYWSMQFEGRPFLKKKGVKEERIDEWKRCTREIMDFLRKSDNDTGDSSRPDIVVVSGHVHKAFFLRSVDNIEHIVCPSLAEGDRAIKKFGEGAYLEIIYHPNPHKIEIIYRNTNNSKVKYESTLKL